MSFAGATDLAFGAFRLSVRDRTLSGETGPISLPSRAFDVLLTLIESRASVVSKDDLMRRVWGDLIVEENNLYVQISAVRRALGPEGRYILTIPGRGYRFIGDLSREAADRRPDAGAGELKSQELESERGNLPVQMTPLIGRQPELAALCALFRAARLVTVVGPGGVGKTKLALAAARALRGRFPAGRWFVELGSSADAASALRAVAARLEVADTLGEPRMEPLVRALRQGDLLLILDGCEHLAEALADHAAALLQRCPRLRILCTSEAPLGVEGEHVRRIGPFDLPPASGGDTAQAAIGSDAVRLFTERATAVDGRFELTDDTAPAIVEICRGLDGMPLAIELAAARAPLLGLESLRSRIAQRLTLLSDEPRNASDRHRSLRTAIEWSYGLLSEAERQILRRLSIFSDSFTLTAAQDVAAGCGFAGWEVVRGVGVLVRRSLVVAGPDLIRPRHRLLQAMRDFLHEQPGFADEYAKVAWRHARYFLDLAQAADGEVGERLARLTPEIENLRTALAWALGPGGDTGLGTGLAAATARFWFESGLPAEARAWLARAMDCAPADAETATLMRLKGLADPRQAARRQRPPSELRH